MATRPARARPAPINMPELVPEAALAASTPAAVNVRVALLENEAGQLVENGLQMISVSATKLNNVAVIV
jgi:hypothetical protein